MKRRETEKKDEDMNDELIEKAKRFATQKHKGQFRANGEPYVNHPLRVAEIVKKFKKSKNITELIIAAILHDTIEDTDATYEEIKEHFGKLVADLVMGLTSDEAKLKKYGKDIYLATKLADSEEYSNWTLVIKLSDRLDNIIDTEDVDKEWMNKYIESTKHLLNFLEENRSLTGTHKRLIKEIRKKMDEFK
jgi:(p)ppGpp synthase/HD superfamily hydrolase